MLLGDYPATAILPVTDTKRAKEFYVDKIGLEMMELPGPEDFMMFKAGAGTSLAVYKRPSVKVEHTQVGFNVDDIEKVMEELKSKGVKFEEYDMPDLKTRNGVAEYEGAKSAWFKDPDGNILSINQMV